MIPLTLKEFALAVGADAKWVQNAKPRLSRSIAYTSSDARWLRLTRTLNRDLRIPLAFASELAHAALERSVSEAAAAPAAGGGSGAESSLDRSGDGAGRDESDSARRVGTASRARRTRSVVCVVAARSDGVRLTVDLRRERSTFDAALAAAMAFGEARRPGRKRRAPTHYRAALGRAWKLGINVGTLRFQARRAAGARLEYPASLRTAPSAPTSHELESQLAGRWWDVGQHRIPEIRYASLADLGSAIDHSAADRSAGHGGASDGGASDGGANRGGVADDMDVTGEHETSFDSESTELGRRMRLTAEVLGPPRWRADLSEEIQLPEAEARRSLLRRFVDADVRFVVVGDLAEALAGATPGCEPEPARKPGAGVARIRVGRGRVARGQLARGQVAPGPAGDARVRPALDLCYAPTDANMRRLANVLRELCAQPLLERTRRDGASTSPGRHAPRVVSAPRTRAPGSAQRPLGAPASIAPRSIALGSIAPGSALPGSAPPGSTTSRSAAAGSAAQRPPAGADEAARSDYESAPFAADPITLRSSTALALTTSFGTIHVRRDVAGIGGFHDVRRRATRVRTFGLELAVLDLPALAHVRTATGTRGDVARLPMLETLLALPALEARHRERTATRTSWIDN